MDGNTKLQNKLDKWESKTERYKAYISRLEMKSQAYENKQDKQLKSYSIVLYGENDKLTGESKPHLRFETSVTTKSQYEKDKPRGLLHKLDAHIKTENLGFIVPVIKTDNSASVGENGSINANAGKRTISLQNKALPTVLQDAIPYTKRTLLAAEDAVLRAGDAFKHTAQPLTTTATNTLRTQLSNQMYKSAQENTGLKATVGISTAVISTGRMVHKWSSNRRQYMTYQKGLKLEQKTERMKAKVEKLELKSALAKEKHDYKDFKEYIKENSIKLTRADKKRAWKKIFDGAQNGNYLERPRMKTFQKASKSDILAAREFNAAKQVYRTKIVKEKYFNTATGRTQTRYYRVVDKSRKRKYKMSKPDDFFVSTSKLGLGVIGNKATSELANSDDVGVQAIGRGLQFAITEMSVASLQHATKSKLKFDKKMDKAQIRMEKAHNKLQLEQSKEESAEAKRKEKEKEKEKKRKEKEKEKAKKKDKKAQKKAATKKRNAQQFKDKMKQSAKKIKDKAAAAVKEFTKKKMLPALIGVGGGIVILLLIIIMPILLLGGNTDTGAVIGVATFTTDREGLIDFNNEVNNLHWEWQSSINSAMAQNAKDDTQEWLLVLNPCTGGPITNCPQELAARAAANANNPEYNEDESNVYSLPTEDNVTKVVKHLYKGEKNPLTNYDIICLYAYYTVKYRDGDWDSFASEFSDFYQTHYVLACKDEYGDIVKDETNSVLLDTHYTTDCTMTQGGTDEDGTPIVTHDHDTTSEEHYVDTTEIWMHYYLYPKDKDNPMTIQKYILEQIKGIGEIDAAGLSEGEKHYNMLLQSLGYHQVIDYPVYYADTSIKVDWSNQLSKFGTYGVLYDVNEGSEEEGVAPDFRYQKETNEVAKICCYDLSQLEVVAGGNGVIKDKSTDTIVIEYQENNLIVTYTCKATDGILTYSGISTEVTTLSIGDKVKTGEHLFNANGEIRSAPGGDYPVYPLIEIKSYDTEEEAYINPILVIRSRTF